MASLIHDFKNRINFKVLGNNEEFDVNYCDIKKKKIYVKL
jgi:hypothetical protein